MNSPDPPAAPEDDAPDDPVTDLAASVSSRRLLTTDELFAGAREVWIQHGDQQYRLRITAAGKVILTQ